MAVMRAALGARVLVPLRPNPFRAITTLHAPGRREDTWSCANSHLYVVRGYAAGAGGAGTAAKLGERLGKVADALGLASQREW